MDKIKAATKKIVDQIFKIPPDTRKFSERIKIEHHDGEIALTRLMSIAKYSRTKCDGNIIVWRNKLLSRQSVEDQVIHFLLACLSRNLSIDNVKDEPDFNHDTSE